MPLIASLLSVLSCGHKDVDLAELERHSLNLMAEPDAHGHTQLSLRLGWKARPLLGTTDTCPRVREGLVATVGGQPLTVTSRGGATEGEYGLHCTGAVFDYDFSDPALFPAGSSTELVLEDSSHRIGITLHDVWARRQPVPRQSLQVRPGQELVFDWSPATDTLDGADLGLGVDEPLPRSDTLLYDGQDYAVPRNYGGLVVEQGVVRVRIPDDAPTGELQLRFSALMLKPSVVASEAPFMTRDSWPWLMPEPLLLTVLE